MLVTSKALSMLDFKGADGPCDSKKRSVLQWSNCVLLFTSFLLLMKVSSNGHHTSEIPAPPSLKIIDAVVDSKFVEHSISKPKDSIEKSISKRKDTTENTTFKGHEFVGHTIAKQKDPLENTTVKAHELVVRSIPKPKDPVENTTLKESLYLDPSPGNKDIKIFAKGFLKPILIEAGALILCQATVLGAPIVYSSRLLRPLRRLVKVKPLVTLTRRISSPIVAGSSRFWKGFVSIYTTTSLSKIVQRSKKLIKVYSHLHDHHHHDHHDDHHGHHDKKHSNKNTK